MYFHLVQGTLKYEPKETTSFYAGRTLADIISMGIGLSTIGAGLGETGAGLALDATGVGIVAGLSLNATGVATIAYGTATVSIASANFGKDLGVLSDRIGEGASDGNIKYPGNDATKAPDKDWEWRGSGDPSSGKGSWYNPKTGESLHPDLNHPDPIGPHWDYQPYRGGPEHRLLPDGTLQPK